MIYQAKVYKPPELLFHGAENPVEVSLVGQFLKRVFRTDKTDRRKPFGKKEFQGVLALVHQDEQRIDNLLS